MSTEGGPGEPKVPVEAEGKVVDLTIERMKLMAWQVGQGLRTAEGQVLTPEHAEEILYSPSRKLAEIILEKFTPIPETIPQVALDRYATQAAGLSKDELHARLTGDEKISEAEAIALAKRALEIFPAPSSSA